MQEEELKKIIFESIKKSLPEADIELEAIELETPKNPEFGDIASNIAFKLAGQLKKSPQDIAGELEKQIPGAKAIAGFLNFKLQEDVYHKLLADILEAGDTFGSLESGKDQRVQVEFISANPTGPLTLANGRGGFGGDVLANVMTKAGYRVEREYYINDGGNQVKVLGESILAAAGLVDKDEDIYRGEYIDEWVKDNKDKIEQRKDAPFELGQLAALDLIKKIKESVKKMNINFDSWFSEKEMIERGEVEEALKFFEEKGLTKKEEGAFWFKTTGFGDDKDRVLVKSDGEKTYFANDAAYHWDKFAERKFDCVINFWGADHHGYVARMKAAVEAMGFDKKLDIVIMQLVRLIKDGQEFKMSKRKGTYVSIDDLFELIGTPDAADVARFFFLSKSFDTHMDFDLDLARDTSEKNPVYYVKYAYARTNGILKNSKLSSEDILKADLSLLKKTGEIELIKKLNELPEIITTVAGDNKYPVHRFTYYAQEVAAKFHRFYHDHRVISEDANLTKARLALVLATKNILKITGEDVLGLSMPERM